MMNKFKVKIPATTANLGLGFDSMGMALDLFLTIEAKLSDDWQFEYIEKELEILASDETNLVAKTANNVARQKGKNMPPLQVRMGSEIPLTRGLGSSSSAIVAGIELADYYCQLEMTKEEKLLTATELEGHPDNVGPCITGGTFVGYYGSGELHYYTIDIGDLGVVVTIPEYTISTDEARKAIPDQYEKAAAVEQNALNNLMLMAMVNKDYQKMGHLMMKDHYHEPYRQPLIKEFQQVKEIALEQDAYASVISGAGPTILTLCKQGQQDQILKALKEHVKDCEHKAVNIYYGAE